MNNYKMHSKSCTVLILNFFKFHSKKLWETKKICLLNWNNLKKIISLVVMNIYRIFDVILFQIKYENHHLYC